MDFRISNHAVAEMQRRDIPLERVLAVLEHPQQIVPGSQGRKVYQSQVAMGGRVFLIRVVVAGNGGPAVVVTVYRTTKVAKYWRVP